MLTGAKIALRSSKMLGTGVAGSDCKVKRSASKALILSNENFPSGLLPNSCLSTAIRLPCLRIFLIIKAKLLSGSMCLVLTRKSKVCGWNVRFKIDRDSGPRFKWLASRNRVENPECFL